MSTEERGLKTPGQIALGCLAVLAIPVLIVFIVAKVRAMPFGDLALMGRFEEHRPALEQLAKLAMAEPNGFSETNSEEDHAQTKYYSLMQGAGISDIVKEADGEVRLHAEIRWDGFLSFDRLCKGFAFSKKEPQTLLNRLDGVDVANGNTAYRKLDKYWYLYLVREDFD